MFKILLFTLFLINLGACRKFVQVDPPINQITGSSVFEQDGTASAAVLGMYAELMKDPGLFSSVDI